MAFYDIILWKWKVHNLSEPKYLHLVKEWTFTILPTVMFQFYIKQFYYKVIKYWFYNTDFWILPYYRISSYLKLVTWLVTPTPFLKKQKNKLKQQKQKPNGNPGKPYLPTLLFSVFCHNRVSSHQTLYHNKPTTIKVVYRIIRLDRIPYFIFFQDSKYKATIRHKDIKDMHVSILYNFKYRKYLNDMNC